MLRLHWTTSLRLPNGYFVLFERSQQGRGAFPEILMLKSLFHPRQAIHLCGIIEQEGLAWPGVLGVGVSRRQVGRPMKGPCFWQGSPCFCLHLRHDEFRLTPYGTWCIQVNTCFSLFSKRLRIVILLSLSLCWLYLKTSLSHSYRNLPEFDIILPAEDRFPGWGRGLCGGPVPQQW